MNELQKTKDPFKGRRGIRGKKKFYYTYEDLSIVTGMSESTLRQRARRKQFDMEDFPSVVSFIRRILPPLPR